MQRLTPDAANQALNALGLDADFARLVAVLDERRRAAREPVVEAGDPRDSEHQRKT